MFEGHADAKLCGDLLLVLLLRLTDALWFELLDGKDASAVLGACFDQADGAAGTTAEDAAPLSVLFCKTGMGSVLEGEEGVRARNRGRKLVVGMTGVVGSRGGDGGG